MRNKKGVVLIFTLLVVVVLVILSSAFYTRTINEKNQARRSILSIEAFWLAEAGVADGIRSMPSSPIYGSLKPNYTYSVNTTKLSGSYYRIDSKGSVAVDTGATIDRLISVVVKISAVSSDNFLYAIETEGDLVTTGEAYTIDGDVNENIILDFEALFGISKEIMKANATYLYDETTFGAPIDGITWVEVTPESQLTTAGNLQGSGILVIEGDTHISGVEDFDGIIYVIGQLTVSGTPTIDGTILAESGADIDTTIKGHVTVNFDIDEITGALGALTFLSTQIVSWREA
jgi:Tfp pilus assembly protein PilX